MTHDLHVLLACVVGVTFAATLLVSAGHDPTTRRIRQQAKRRASERRDVRDRRRAA